MSEPLPLALTMPATILTGAEKDLDQIGTILPPGQHGALLLHVDLISGQPTGGFTIVEKLGDHWNIALDGSVGLTNGHLDPAIGFAVKGSW